MKYDPTNKKLYTDDGELIKQMHCPYKVGRKDLNIQEGELICGKCESPIADTAVFTDEELLNKLKSEPDTCLKVDLNQDNIDITFDNDESI